jgi:molybdenum cofactor cytidylyltransferase
MPTTTNIAVLIPAAGTSKRFGRPKQLLKWGDSTLIGQAIATALELSQQKVLVVLGAYYDRIKPEIKGFDIQILKNEAWEIGLGSSIAMGADCVLKSEDTFSGLLVLLPDQPLIVSSYLKAMLEEFNNGEKQIIATSYGKGKFGVPAIFGQSYFKELSLLQDDHGAKNLIKQYSNYVTALAITPVVTDIDTEDDYTKIYKANHQ